MSSCYDGYMVNNDENTHTSVFENNQIEHRIFVVPSLLETGMFIDIVHDEAYGQLANF